MPFYNELESLPGLIQDARSSLSSLDLELDLVLVDDGSEDGSGELAEELVADLPFARVVHHDGNLAYGAALTTGFREARGDVVGYTDADLPVSFELFSRFFERMTDADLLLGFPSVARRTPRRTLYSWGYRGLVRTFLGVDVRDVNFPFKMVRRELVDRLELGARTGFIDAQLLAEAQTLGARRLEVAVESRPREHGESHFDSPLKALETGRELLSWWLAKPSS